MSGVEVSHHTRVRVGYMRFHIIQGRPSDSAWFRLHRGVWDIFWASFWAVQLF